ncbi:hypothetical protein FKM82_015750 [Ascaphus truei]
MILSLLLLRSYAPSGLYSWVVECSLKQGAGSPHVSPCSALTPQSPVSLQYGEFLSSFPVSEDLTGFLNSHCGCSLPETQSV